MVSQQLGQEKKLLTRSCSHNLSMISMSGVSKEQQSNRCSNRGMSKGESGRWWGQRGDGKGLHHQGQCFSDMHVNHLGDILKADSDSVGQGGTHGSVFLTSSSVDAFKKWTIFETSLVGLCWNFSKKLWGRWEAAGGLWARSCVIWHFNGSVWLWRIWCTQET